MLDAIEVDVEHSERVNRSVLSCRSPDPRNPFRQIDVLWLQPVGRHRCRSPPSSPTHVPTIVRYLMRGLGSDEAITELLSYLLFDPAFCSRLIELGRDDVLAAKAEILRFAAGDGAPAPVTRAAR